MTVWILSAWMVMTAAARDTVDQLSVPEILDQAWTAARDMPSMTETLDGEDRVSPRSYAADGSLVREYDPALELAQAPFWVRYWDDHAELSFVAARHGEDSRTFAIIDTEFRDLRPSAVIVEGVREGSGLLPPPGEPRHADSLARQVGLDATAGEPPAKAELAGILAEDCSTGRRCTIHDFQGFYTIRTLAARREDRPSLDKIAGEFSTEYGVRRDELMDEKTFRDWYRTGNGREFPPDLEQLNPEDAWPRAGAVELSRRVAGRLSIVRNRFLAGRIAQALSKPPGRVLVVYGAGHHMELRAVIEDMLGPHHCAGNAPQDRRPCGAVPPQ